LLRITLVIAPKKIPPIAIGRKAKIPYWWKRLSISFMRSIINFNSKKYWERN